LGTSSLACRLAVAITTTMITVTETTTVTTAAGPAITTVATVTTTTTTTKITPVAAVTESASRQFLSLPGPAFVFLTQSDV
jgi:hypothetical protein